jgi:hypothetical protein
MHTVQEHLPTRTLSSALSATEFESQSLVGRSAARKP